MTKSWIIFKLGGQQVYQIPYNGCTGQDTIDSYKDMIAQEYNVEFSDIKVAFDDKELATTPKPVSSSIKSEITRILETEEINN